MQTTKVIKTFIKNKNMIYSFPMNIVFHDEKSKNTKQHQTGNIQNTTKNNQQNTNQSTSHNGKLTDNETNIDELIDETIEDQSFKYDHKINFGEIVTKKRLNSLQKELKTLHESIMSDSIKFKIQNILNKIQNIKDKIEAGSFEIIKENNKIVLKIPSEKPFIINSDQWRTAIKNNNSFIIFNHNRLFPDKQIKIIEPIIEKTAIPEKKETITKNIIEPRSDKGFFGQAILEKMIQENKNSFNKEQLILIQEKLAKGNYRVFVLKNGDATITINHNLKFTIKGSDLINNLASKGNNFAQKMQKFLPTTTNPPPPTTNNN